ncbi:MAG: ATP-dependent protease ATPase subunit HslU [Planctomycetota bacterium]
MEQLTPRQIVSELDKFIVGQSAAKKAVAIAIRNRWRRQQLPDELREEVAPKNIIMIGPTGVGKTEIARRMALLLKAPFIKVEASKFTEVGYVGRDVESIIRELAEASVNNIRREHLDKVRETGRMTAEDRLLELLLEQKYSGELNDTAAEGATATGSKPGGQNIPNIQVPGGGAINLNSLIEGMAAQLGMTPPNQPKQPLQTPQAAGTPTPTPAERRQRREQLKATLRQQLHKGELDDLQVEISVTDKPSQVELVGGQGLEQMGVDFQGLFERIIPQRTRSRKVHVPEALKLLVAQESEKLIDREKIVSEAVRRTENAGIVFIDEIDKICTPHGQEGTSSGPQVSREGVQRDLLPIIEGSTVNTRYGPVRTQHILFVAAGAFHMSSPSDLIPELQGRFPVRVELRDLTREDFVRILTEPRNALIRQYQALLRTDDITLVVTPDGIDEIARIAVQVNERNENIGARRLHTILERLLEDIAFQAPEVGKTTFTLDREAVFLKLAGVVDNDDLSRYVL